MFSGVETSGMPRHKAVSRIHLFFLLAAASAVIPAVTGGMKTVTAVMTGIMTIAFCTIGMGPILEAERKRKRKRSTERRARRA